MERSIPSSHLIDRLVSLMDRPSATGIVEALVQTNCRRDAVEAVLVLLDELEEMSAKVTRVAMEALPELQRRGALDEVVPWLDLGIALAGSSGAIAMKYFKESPLVVGLIEPPAARAAVFTTALELTEQDANVALEYFRAAPELLAILPSRELDAWIEIGIELVGADHVLGIEYIRQIPSLARVLPVAHVRAWVGFGMKLITQNSLGKTDYIGTLEFFRTSPTILGAVEGEAARKALIDFGSLLADRTPEAAIAALAEAPSLLSRLPSQEWRLRTLHFGALVAERDGDTALSYLRRCPDILALIGSDAGASSKFEDWFKAGMEILSYSVEGARAYFALETSKALASVEKAMSGVPLRQVARSLKLFAQALCGSEVSIAALPETDGSSKESARATVSQNGRGIALPAVLNRYPAREENIRLYMVMTAHEAGHLEFGTYTMPLVNVADLIEEVMQRYGKAQDATPSTLAAVFALYPQPGVIRDLWTILEDARVERLLRREYPGFSRDLALLARDAVTTRSLLQGMSVREMIVDALLLYSTAEAGTFRIPDSISDIVAQLWAQCQTILTFSSTAEDAVRLAHRVYVLLEEAVMPASPSVPPEQSSDDEPDIGTGPKASETTMGEYRPVTNWAYRGAMNPDFVHDESESAQSENGSGNDQETFQSAVASGGGATYGKDSADRRLGSEGDRRPEAEGAGLAPGRRSPSVIEELLALQDDRSSREEPGEDGRRVFRYPEWDAVIQDYRMGWCRVVEQEAVEGNSDFVEETLAFHGGSVRLLRRYFESLRPPGLRRVSGQTEGDDVDLDAAVRRIVDVRAGADPTDHIYVRREKRERDVAAAFLIDLSGSTSRQIENGRQVVDVEKEGLVLLCEALEAVGDRYAVFGYSGHGRNHVEFLVIKNFDEPIAGRALQRIGGMMPRHQNRDGAAIRHAVRKLTAQQAKTKMLILISDGKPLDDDYRDEYSLEDTKKALQEARMSGVHPFCITIDHEADEYVRRMYGDVRCLVIDRIETLPAQMPRIYRRLTA
ncbi:MAG: nitric oxide reductase activation protein NorD [Nitrospiraceae bacterium]